jgi:hypothetical protein
MPATLTRHVRRSVIRRPFLCLGLFTFAAFLSVEVFGMPPALAAPLRALIAPLWVMRTIEMFLGLGYLPGPAQFVLALPLLFLPYVAADWLLGRARRRHRAHRAAAI